MGGLIHDCNERGQRSKEGIGKQEGKTAVVMYKKKKGKNIAASKQVRGLNHSFSSSGHKV
jgi:hypothetical protein